MIWKCDLEALGGCLKEYSKILFFFFFFEEVNHSQIEWKDLGSEGMAFGSYL